MKKPKIVDLIFMNLNPQDFHDSLIFTEYEVIFLSKIASNNLQLQQIVSFSEQKNSKNSKILNDDKFKHATSLH